MLIYWMNFDSAYRLANSEPVDEAVGRRAKLYSLFPVREMMKRQWIEQSDNLDVVEHRVCQFFQIKSLNERPKLPHAAKAAQYDERTSLSVRMALSRSPTCKGRTCGCVL